MSNVICQLANIPLRDSVLDQLELDKVFENFAKNYKKLDDLKNFRSEYEQRNFLSRWWDNDKLRDAQLDSAEVQAEFSKTLGQLVAISVIQAKELNEQQRRLGDQQRTIQGQVIAVREHSKEIEQQQHIQDEQADKLKQLVADYISVKGISDDSIRRLAKIVAEIDRTKEEFFAESRRVDEHLSSELEILGNWAQSALDKLEDKINVGSATFQNALQSLGDSQTKNHLSLVADIKVSIHKQSQLEAKLKELGDFSRREIVLLDERIGSKLQTVDGLIQGLRAKATAAEQQVRENAEHANKNLTAIDNKLKELDESSHRELALLNEKTTSKLQTVDGLIQGLGARATAAEQQVRENAERANKNLTAIDNKLKELGESSYRELALLNEKTTSKLQTVDGLIQGLGDRATAIEQQAREDAERAKQLKSENAAILNGCIGLQKEITALKVEATQANQRAKFVLIFASVSFLAALGTLGMQLLRV